MSEPMHACIELQPFSLEEAKEMGELLSVVLPEQHQAQKSEKWSQRVYTFAVLFSEDWGLEIAFCGRTVWLDFKPTFYIRGVPLWKRST